MKTSKLIITVILSVVLSVILVSLTISFLVFSEITIKDNLQLIDVHSDVPPDHEFSTFRGFRIIDESTLYVIFNNYYNNAYFSGGEQIAKIDAFTLSKEYNVGDMFAIGTTSGDTKLYLQIFKLDQINIENNTATFNHFASEIPYIDNPKQSDYVGKKVIVS